MGRHEEGVKHFGECLGMDKYLVVGWFQRGVSYLVSLSVLVVRLVRGTDGR
jgi:hypothetical protein